MGRNRPCYGCPDRYTACSDHCRKPEFLEYRAELETIRRNRAAYDLTTGYTANEIRKNRRVR